MIKILRKLFSRRLRRKEPEDVMKIARLIGPLIDKTAKEIFMTYQTRLLTQPISYIVPAVWGAKKEGELEDTQKEINRQIIPVIKELFAALESKDLDAPQEYAIGFLIRGLIISKITFMIEMMKNQGIKIDQGNKVNDILNRKQPLGNA